MNNKKTGLSLLAFGILIVFVIVYLETKKDIAPLPPVAEPTKVNVFYLCSEDKSIAVTYTIGKATKNANPNLPPTATGSVTIPLAEGKTITLPQTVSADGARFANADESVLFWSKGNSVLFEEKGVQNYKNCIILSKDPGNLPNSYKNDSLGFTMRYPSDYTVNDQYLYTALGSEKEIKGVSFTIASSTASGTNLSKDSYISIENKGGIVDCSASLFLQPGAATSTKVESGSEYSYGTTVGAAAGNRYEETVYAFPHGTTCFAVRYFIHYSAFENYPAGSIKEFDKESLATTFDAIRKSIILN